MSGGTTLRAATATPAFSPIAKTSGRSAGAISTTCRTCDSFQAARTLSRIVDSPQGNSSLLVPIRRLAPQAGTSAKLSFSPQSLDIPATTAPQFPGWHWRLVRQWEAGWHRRLVRRKQQRIEQPTKGFAYWRFGATGRPVHQPGKGTRDIAARQVGVGGHCIAVDPWFIVDPNPELTPLLQAARRVNDDKPHQVVAHVRELCERNGWRNILCVGLTYKADVDDFRESPALQVATELTRLWPGRVACADPSGEALAAGAKAALALTEIDAGLAWADTIVCLVNHSLYREAMLACDKPLIDMCGLRRSAASGRPEAERAIAVGSSALELVRR
jgi:hypothetical protein